MISVPVVVVAIVAITAGPYVVFGLLYLAIRPTGVPGEKQPAEPTVSVVLPTHNEERIVEQKIEELCGLDYPASKLEVVVIDSSDDRTPDIVESFFAGRDEPAMQLIREEGRRGLAVALNEAYAAAGNDVVVKTDCDSRIGPDAVRQAVETLADPSVGAVTGRNVDVLGGSEVEAGYRGVQARIQLLESHLDSTLIFHGPFSAFERKEIVPIDEDSIADDTELALKIRRNGKRAIFDPTVQYMEAAHSSFRKRRKQKDRRAMGLIRLLVRHRDALGRYGRYGRVVLPFNWWFMVVSPWLLALALILATTAAVSIAGLAGFGVPVAVVAFVVLGSRDTLGPAQPVYAIFDTQVSLLRAAVLLVLDGGDGTWEVDQELREAYE